MRISGLYAITPETDDTDWLCRRLEQVLSGGASIVQYRQKGLSEAAAERQGRAVHALCGRHGRPLIVNDSLELALAIGAEGVHLGRDDADPATARRQLGPGRLIGVSCYDDFERALAVAGIADHVAFGSVFASSTKPSAVTAPLSLFARARVQGFNTVAIGGIDAGNARRVIEAGADAIAVISALFGGEDALATARALSQVFDPA